MNSQSQTSTYTKLEIITITGQHIIAEGSLATVKRFAAVNGVSINETYYKVMELSGGIAQYDTTIITGYGLEKNGEHVGMILRWKNGAWNIIIRNESVDLSADEMSAILNNNIVGGN